MRSMQGHSEENVTLKTAQTLIHSKCAIYMPGELTWQYMPCEALCKKRSFRSFSGAVSVGNF